MPSPDLPPESSGSTPPEEVPDSIVDYYRLDQLQDLVELAENLTEILADET